MLHKTRGIVLKTTKYSETSLIAHIYTEKFGMQSYLLNGVRKNKSKIRPSMLQALHLLDMVVYYKNTGGLQRVSDLKNDPAYQHIPFDIIKSSLALFVCDVVYHALREHEGDEQLFDFLSSSFQWLDESAHATANFHLLFMIRLSKFLGFNPSGPQEEDALYFDLRDGIFSSDIPAHPSYTSPEITAHWKALLKLNYENMGDLKLNAATRNKVLNSILSYFEYHLEHFRGVKSHHVLEEVLG